MNIRCSSLPRILACPASAVPPATAIDTGGEYAAVGSAVHAVLAQWVTEGVWDVDSAVERYGVGRDEVSRPAWTGRKLWALYEGRVEVVHVEKEMSSEFPRHGFTLTGHPDMCLKSMVGLDLDPTRIIWDCKSTRFGGGHSPLDQLLGYLYLWFDEDMEMWDRPSKAIIAWLRDGFCQVIDVTGDIIRDWQSRLFDAMEDRKTFAPSAEACKYCPRSHECPAKTALLQESVLALAPSDGPAVPMTPERLAKLKPMRDVLKNEIQRYDKALALALQEHGSLPLDDERELYLSEETRESINAGPAWAVLTEEIPIEDLRGALRVVKGDLMKIAMARAPYGGKKAYADELLDKLRAAGAVRTRTYRTPSVRKRVKEMGDGD